MQIRTLSLLLVSIITLQACGGAADAPAPAPASSTSGSTSSESSRSAKVSCEEFFSEFRAGVLGHLRGTEQLGLIAPVTALAASTYDSATTPVTVPKSTCSFAGRSLRKARKPDAFAAVTLAPACSALIERIDRDCLKPLVEASAALSDSCKNTLIGFSTTREGVEQVMGSADKCGDR